jgi:hypothetical protein
MDTHAGSLYLSEPLAFEALRILLHSPFDRVFTLDHPWLATY